MRTEIEAKIQQVLNTHLEELTLSPSLPIAWPEKDFIPPPDGRWLRANELPAPTVPFGVDSINDYTGIFQVDVVWPRNETFMPPTEIAGAVIRHFKPRTRLLGEGLQVILTSVSRAPHITDNAAIFIPVSIYYRSFAEPA